MTKTIFITGASSGIGRETALFFAAKGWNVVATMRDPGKDKNLTNKANISLLQLDVTNEASIAEAVSAAVGKHGRIDVLLNNAGYGSLGIFESSTAEQIRRQIDTNVVGMMSVTKTILPTMRAQGSGTIINVSSIAGHLGLPLFSIYNSTKFAVEGFSESLRYELLPFGIRVKIIEPGPIKTDFYTRSMELFANDTADEYKAMGENVTKFIIDQGLKSQGPEVVVKQIYKAATSSSNRLRYPAGLGALPLILARKHLPDCMIRAMVRVAMKL